MNGAASDMMSDGVKTNGGATPRPPPPSAGMTLENQGTWDRFEKK